MRESRRLVSHIEDRSILTDTASMDEDKINRFGLWLSSIAVIGFALSVVVKNQDEEKREAESTQKRCERVAQHNFGVDGKWDDEQGCCTIRVTMTSGDPKGHSDHYDADECLDQVFSPTF
jgi:hypothetical protein